MRPFVDRISERPAPYDEGRGRETAESIGVAQDLIIGAMGASPYLARLAEAEADWLSGALTISPEEAFAGLVSPLGDHGSREAASALRQIKRRAALLIGLADLGGVWNLAEVTGALSDLADFAVDQALTVSLGQEHTGPLVGLSAAEAGLICLAMGKGGARELNYSSDIDLIFFFDDERLGRDLTQEVKSRWTKVIQRVVKLLSETTGEGYVFRTDLRLRPNPSVTPICVPVTVAERYYESMGRTWERSAFIKARAAVGDIAAGERFLADLSPFVWRRHLDFAALEDINDIRAKIRDAKGLSEGAKLPGYDLKLGPGGIREIEFFAQTQQLAFGGRDLSLRVRGTCEALDALATAGRIERADAEALKLDYTAHRRLEHRLQMLEDAQTHAIPVSEEARNRIAALGGWPDRSAMERETRERLSSVRARVNRFFGHESAEPAAIDVSAFARPDFIREMTERWGLGGLAATRDQRARRKIRALTPKILERLATSGDPDEAAIQFDRFLTGLPAGVQLFSLFEANPQLLDLLAEICASAPNLAEYLARNANVLDKVLDADFFQPLPSLPVLSEELAATIRGNSDYEYALDGVRRWAKERRFQVGVQVLQGLADEREAGRAFSDIAEASIAALKPCAEAEFARRHGPPPGRGAAVIAMGKLGSREMTASSDLDLIVVYDAAGADASVGDKPLTVGLYFARLTQKLVSAMTTLTAEGALYEVDMRLRPSGGQGPVAVSFESFRNYQKNEAWTWEHMALCRARVVAGASDLADDLEQVIDEVLSSPRDRAAVTTDVAEMRARVAEANKSRRDALWAIKHGAGGLMDIEFATLAALLAAGRRGPRAPGDMLAFLEASGAMSGEEAAALASAYSHQSRLQQMERVALAGAMDPETAGLGLKLAMARVGGAESFEALEVRLAEERASAKAIADRRLVAR